MTAHAEQQPLRLLPAPDPVIVELLYRTFGDVLIPVEKLRERYFRNLNEGSFADAITTGRIQLPVTTLVNSRKAPKYAHIKHVASLIDIRAYRADEDMPRPETDSTEQG